MNLPTSQSLPPEDDLPPARRRRQRRLVIPEASDARSRFIDELGLRAVPGADFFLSALLAGLVLGVAFLLDSPGLVVLAILLAPFMAPVMGMAISAAGSSLSFFARSLASWFIGGIIFFLTGTLAGIGALAFLPGRASALQEYSHHLTPNGPDLLLMAVGAGLTAYLMLRSNQKPLISSAALVYVIYVPLGAAGFALTSGASPDWNLGLLLACAQTVLAALLATGMMAVRGLAPRSAAGFGLTGAYALLSILALVLSGLSAGATPRPAVAFSPSATPEQSAGVPAAPQPTAPLATQPLSPLPSSSSSPTAPPAAPSSGGTPTPTRTLVPSRTPTLTVTPAPTPVYAVIAAPSGDGAFVRAEPAYNAAIVQILSNGWLVEVLPDVQRVENVTWVKVRVSANGKEGWIVRSLLATATPAPGW